LVTAASYAGTALAFGLSPLLISRYGWQTVFYTFGGLAIVWLPLWLPQSVLGADGGPSSSGSSSSSSSRLKKDGKASPVDDGGSSSSDTEGQPLLPGAAAAGGSSGLAPAATGFAALMRRREVWAICATQYAQSYGMYGLLTWLPSFFSDYYGVAVADLGGYTLLPYFVQGCVGAGAGALADDLLSRRGWSVRSVRIALQLAGMLGPAGCLLAAVSPLAAGDPGAASALITLGLGLSALTLGAVSVNNFDIAPSHAGVVFGAGNTAATLAGLVSVPATGWVLQRTASWPLVFGLIAGHFVVGSAVWVAWMGDRPLPEDGPEPGVQAATAAQP
jgi:ACS family sodium-dependent inorganic phosphate cotransporter